MQENNVRRAPVINLAHAAFNMRNEEEMLHFYRDILGMKELFTLTLRPVLDRLSGEGADEESIAPDKQEYLHWLREAADRPWITYLKLADGQFLELFHNLGRFSRIIPDRRAVYGYTKLNYEVDDVLALKEHLAAAGVELKDDYHPTIDGAFEISVLDPDGNEVQFTQYGGHARITHAADPAHRSLSRINYTTQVAFDVQDTAGMPTFYGTGLGLTKKLTLTAGDLAEAVGRSGHADPAMLDALMSRAEKPWIEYYEAGPHQYIELFYSLGGPELKEDRNLEDAFGYQHICLEVSDIHAAWDAVTANGLKPETDITLGLAGALQFWLRDPDGNRIEMMQYLEDSLQRR